MDLYILTQRDPIFVDEFLRNIDYSKFTNVYIFDAPNFGSGKLRGITKFVKLFGLKTTAKFAIGVVLNKPIKLPNVTRISASWSECCLQLERAEVAPDDILLSVSAPHKIDCPILKKFNTALNFHCGKLPDYAGMMPMFWQRYEGKSKYVITIHELSENIDEGKILFEADFPFHATLINSMIDSKSKSAILFNLYVSNLLKISNKAQNGGVYLRRYPTQQQIRDFRKKYEARYYFYY